MRIEEQALTHLHLRKYVHQTADTDDFTDLPRPYFTLAYLICGQLECETASDRFLVEPGDILFVPFRQRYILRWAGSPQSATYSCHFNFPAYSEPFGNKEFSLQKIAAQTDKEAVFAYLCNQEHQRACSLGVFGAFYSLCHALYPHLKYEKVFQLDARIQKAVDYLNLHYRSRIAINELAHISNLSPSRFHYCFKKELGMTAIEYKNSLCVKHASLLLISEPDKSIEEISMESGFNSSEYFRRSFKAATGQTPRDYRKNAAP